MKTTITINPFKDVRKGQSPETYTYRGESLFTHRGVEVYWNSKGSYDYVFEGMTITQRHGMSCKIKAAKLIDDMLDGTGCEYRPENVCAHLRKFGHAAKSYADSVNDAE